jgi:WD40 repeat protein
VPTYSTNLPRLSDDGSVLVAFDGRHQAWMWNVDQRTPERFTFLDSKNATVSGDGRYAFTSTPQGTVHVWDTADGRLVSTLSGRIDPGSPLEASRDASKLLVIHRGGVRLLPCDLCLDRTSLLRLAERRVTRRLTAVERRRYLQ